MATPDYGQVEKLNGSSLTADPVKHNLGSTIDKVISLEDELSML